jgi:Phytanoyl-CoA dioxygenase (PhyH)
VSRFTEQHANHFHAFGFVVLVQWLSEKIASIEQEFERLMSEERSRHDGALRTLKWQMIDSSPVLASLLDTPEIESIFDRILGSDWQYFGSTGNLYAGDTGWHTDDYSRHDRIKIGIYLDSADAESGALRVIPLSHRISEHVSELHTLLGTSRKSLGVHGSAVPAISLATEPGDVIVFHHNILHSAWHGGSARRMISINGHAAYGPAEQDSLESTVLAASRFLIPTVYGPHMREGAPPERLRHLRQPLLYERELARAVAERVAAGEEPARDLLPDLSDNEDVAAALAEFRRDADYVGAGES